MNERARVKTFTKYLLLVAGGKEAQRNDVDIGNKQEFCFRISCDLLHTNPVEKGDGLAMERMPLVSWLTRQVNDQRRQQACGVHI